MGLTALIAVAVPSAASASTGFEIVTLNSAKCMTNGGSMENSTPITQYACNGTDNQEWNDPTDAAVVNADSGKCMTNGGSTANSAPIMQYTCNGSPNQTWYINLNPSTGNFTIQNTRENTAETLCMTNGGSMENSTPITQYKCNESNNQQWQY
jgi:alpha-glucosidase